MSEWVLSEIEFPRDILGFTAHEKAGLIRRIGG
jgi:hypothetical protein